ncbi:MAG: hypothetical protein GXO48_00510 [Chlorobi bacterium]|nr:hypothetical protein [Chlorobiota bacterium]
MNRIFALLIFSLLNSTLPSFAQAIYPEPMCEVDLDSLHTALKKNHYKILNREYILILVNTGVDKHTMAHLVHYSYVRIRRKFGHIPITWVFNEILTPNKKAQEYMLRNVMRLPLEDTNSVYLFNDDLFNNLWQQIEKKCKHKSSLKIDAFSVMNSNVYDAIRLKTEKIENLYIPLHSSGLRLEKITDLPDSLAFSPLSQTTVLPDGNLIRVERADNKLYYINYHTGKTQVLWEYDYDKALDFFINVMAWDEEARQKAQEMGLYPPDWNRESFRLVSVKATKDKLFVTATFEAPCPLDKDITYINAEGEQKTMETANT